MGSRYLLKSWPCSETRSKSRITCACEPTCWASTATVPAAGPSPESASSSDPGFRSGSPAIASRPHYRILFGPVSISNQYHWISRELIVAFSKSHRRSELTQYVMGNIRLGRNLPKQFGLKATCPLVENLRDLSEIVSCIGNKRRRHPHPAEALSEAILV